MKILITGAQGMLGRTLMKYLAGRYDVMGMSRADADLTKESDVNSFIGSARPSVIIHAAAMTQVDLCEQNQTAAFLANETASRHVACAGERYKSRVIALSTDYVFKGDLNRPYHEQDQPDPQTVYGKSKWAAEKAIAQYCPNHTILRTSWLYGQGGPSFIHTITKLASSTGEPLKVVHDQIGNPTSADALAVLIEHLLNKPMLGVIHGSCEGQASWYQLACEVVRLKNLKRLIVPCASVDYPLPASRPANSRLENRVINKEGFPSMPLWQDALARFVHQYPQM